MLVVVIFLVIFAVELNLYGHRTKNNRRSLKGPEISV